MPECSRSRSGSRRSPRTARPGLVSPDPVDRQRGVGACLSATRGWLRPKQPCPQPPLSHTRRNLSAGRARPAPDRRGRGSARTESRGTRKRTRMLHELAQLPTHIGRRCRSTCFQLTRPTDTCSIRTKARRTISWPAGVLSSRLPRVRRGASLRRSSSGAQEVSDHPFMSTATTTNSSCAGRRASLQARR